MHYDEIRGKWKRLLKSEDDLKRHIRLRITRKP